MKNHYIYKITNKTTGEYYYGKRSCHNGWQADNYMGSGTLLKKKMEVHPDHEWIKEVLLILDTEEEAFEYERVVIGDKWDTDPLCLNLTPGGLGSTSGSAKRNWSRNREAIIEGQSKVPHETRQAMGLKCQQLHGERLVKNLNDYAKSDRGREISSRTRQEYFSNTDNCEKFKTIMKTCKATDTFKDKVRKPICMIDSNRQEIIIERDSLLAFINNGYNFFLKYVHLHNKKLGVYIEGVASWKAIVLLKMNNGWEYGKNRSLTKASISQVNLDTGDLLS